MSRRFVNLRSAYFWTQAFACCLFALAASLVPVRAQSRHDPVYVFHTNLGNINVQLFPDVAPNTVANFLSYVNSGAYANSLIHRSVPGFIFQGGGYTVQNNSFAAIPTASPVVNEFHLSNTRGTIAMAKLSGDPNSATSQWFFNEADNSANLDNQNGGFTVFGRIADSASLAVMDQIAAVPVPNPSPFNPPLDQMPILNYQAGSPVSPSQLVTVLSITPALTHVLWNNVSGQASIWNYNTAAGTFSQNTYGPYAGWTAKSIADGPDGSLRVLWDNADGRLSLWNLDNAAATFSQYTFGSYAGWTANGVSVGPDNKTHVLWTNTSGAVSLWNYNTADGSFTFQNYGPFPGWTAQSLADGPDGKTRVLWNHTSGQMSLWNLDNTTGVYTHAEFGPYAGWTANGVSVGPDNTTHVLWTHAPDGQSSIWNYNTAAGTFSQNTYGPYAGWTAKSIADGPDGSLRVLWDNADGRLSLWNLDNAAATFSQYTFGSYAGWSASAIAGGP